MGEFVSHQEKTRAFFGQEVEDLDLVLPGTFINLVDGSKLRVDQTEPWFRDAEKVINQSDIGELKVINRPGIERLQVGDLWLCPLKFRRIDQTVLVAQDRGVVGACIRIVRASGSERDDSYTILPREGDIAKYLIEHGGLQSNWVGRLRFLDVLDDELSLQVLGSFEEVSKRRLDYDSANEALEEYFKAV